MSEEKIAEISVMWDDLIQKSPESRELEKFLGFPRFFDVVDNAINQIRDEEKYLCSFFPFSFVGLSMAFAFYLLAKSQMNSTATFLKYIEDGIIKKGSWVQVGDFVTVVKEVSGERLELFERGDKTGPTTVSIIAKKTPVPILPVYHSAVKSPYPKQIRFDSNLSSELIEFQKKLYSADSSILVIGNVGSMKKTFEELRIGETRLADIYDIYTIGFNGKITNTKSYPQAKQFSFHQGIVVAPHPEIFNEWMENDKTATKFNFDTVIIEDQKGFELVEHQEGLFNLVGDLTPSRVLFFGDYKARLNDGVNNYSTYKGINKFIWDGDTCKLYQSSMDQITEPLSSSSLQAWNKKLLEYKGFHTIRKHEVCRSDVDNFSDRWYRLVKQLNDSSLPVEFRWLMKLIYEKVLYRLRLFPFCFQEHFGIDVLADEIQKCRNTRHISELSQNIFDLAADIQRYLSETDACLPKAYAYKGNIAFDSLMLLPAFVKQDSTYAEEETRLRNELGIPWPSFTMQNYLNGQITDISSVIVPGFYYKSMMEKLFLVDFQTTLDIFVSDTDCKQFYWFFKEQNKAALLSNFKINTRGRAHLPFEICPSTAIINESTISKLFSMVKQSEENAEEDVLEAMQSIDKKIIADENRGTEGELFVDARALFFSDGRYYLTYNDCEVISMDRILENRDPYIKGEDIRPGNRILFHESNHSLITELLKRDSTFKVSLLSTAASWRVSLAELFKQYNNEKAFARALEDAGCTCKFQTINNWLVLDEDALLAPKEKKDLRLLLKLANRSDAEIEKIADAVSTVRGARQAKGKELKKTLPKFFQELDSKELTRNEFDIKDLGKVYVLTVAKPSFCLQVPKSKINKFSAKNNMIEE